MIIYDGEYYKGIRYGKGKEYNKYGELEYEGDFYIERHGKGKEYNRDGDLRFEGEYANGKRNGKGKAYYNGKLIYEGEYLNDKRNGKGKEYDEEGRLIFEGIFFYGEKNIFKK